MRGPLRWAETRALRLAERPPHPRRFAPRLLPARGEKWIKLPRSRDASASELSFTLQESPSQNLTPKNGGRRSAERRHSTGRTGGCGARHAKRMLPLAWRFGRARLSALHRGSRQRLESHRLNSRPCFLGRGSKRALPAFHLSQSRDCTSRAGRSTGVNDARSRPGAGRNPARRDRPRSTFESTLAKGPSVNEMDGM